MSFSLSLSLFFSLLFFLLSRSLSPAEICISKSLLLFRFCPDAACAPPPCPDLCKAADSPIAPALPHSMSISEADFQACSTVSSSQSPTRVEASSLASSDPEASSCAGAQGSRGSTESLHSQCGEPASPLTFSRRVPFSRGRLRLLSYRSVEETRPAPSVKDRFPVLKHIFSFVKDMAISETRYDGDASLSSLKSCCRFL